MNTWIKIARYQLTNRYVFVTGPWLILALGFLIALAWATSDPPLPGHAAYRARPPSTSTSSPPGRWPSPGSCRSRWPSA